MDEGVREGNMGGGVREGNMGGGDWGRDERCACGIGWEGKSG